MPQFEFDEHSWLWIQQAKPNVVLDWKFWERATQDPKMTYYLKQGVKAKMCETTLFVNTLGTQYMAARARVELACEFGIYDKAVSDILSGKVQVVQNLLVGKLHKQPVPPRHSWLFPFRLLCPRGSNCLLCRCTFALYCPNIEFFFSVFMDWASVDDLVFCDVVLKTMLRIRTIKPDVGFQESMKEIRWNRSNAVIPEHLEPIIPTNWRRCWNLFTWPKTAAVKQHVLCDADFPHFLPTKRESPWVFTIASF